MARLLCIQVLRKELCGVVERRRKEKVLEEFLFLTRPYRSAISTENALWTSSRASPAIQEAITTIPDSSG